LRDIASLVGPEALEDRDHLTIEVAALVREGVLRQSAYDPNDALCSPHKTHALAAAAIAVLAAGEAALARGTAFADLDLVPARRSLVALRDAAETDVDARAADAAGASAALAASHAAVPVRA
jgi:V/A-type H+-transporting ATPase subunit A